MYGSILDYIAVWDRVHERKFIIKGEYFEIPYMTETDWELGNRRVPPYLLRLMAYKIQMEKLADKKRVNENGDRRGTNIKKLPFAFTEQGIYMLATVLRGKLRNKRSIYLERYSQNGVSFNCFFYKMEEWVQELL